MNHRWLARGVVVALHAAALLALLAYRPPRLAEPGERRLTAIRLIEPQRPRPAPPDPLRPVAPPLTSPPIMRPPVISPDAAEPDGAAAPPATAAEPQSAPAEPPRTTLRLTLPPGYAASTAAARNPALSDPRSNSPKPTLESRIANAAAVTGEWVEERTSDGRTRRRRGDTCVETQESRIASIDRFNQNVAPRAAPMTGQTYKCQ
ncbi:MULTISPECIES: hypothetical protein [unclassified Roseateles]|uniref:hypothetical protein n=1 Tax=unclassified Roseateles TaxID=2626991 RepID=UPI0006FA69FD|nr:MULTISPECIES: hypothetical protein [unclassified Roseateles]KQW52058.1 hypothetical protein ASC81_05535 [Pelomonas sp. Root405]KRA78292.1 hypothetical protein ASD88_05540 [Pelomonas sp. Root662]